MKSICALTLSLLLFVSINAQKPLPVFEINNDTGYAKNLPEEYFEVLKEDNTHLNINDLKQGKYASLFHSANSFNPSPLSSGIYWKHFFLKNTSNQPIEIALYSNGDITDIYVLKSNGKSVRSTSGIYVPWSKRSGLKEVMEIPVTLNAGEVTEIYERDEYWHRLPLGLNVSIDFANQLIKDNYLNNKTADGNFLLSSFIAGILLFAAFTNLRFYVIVKEKFYLLYSLFLICFAFLYSPLSFFLKEHPFTDFYVSSLSFYLALFFFAHFFRYYFQTFNKYALLDKWLILVSILPLLIFTFNYPAANIFSENIQFFLLKWGNKSYLLLLNSLLLTALLYIGTGKMSTGIIATLPPLIFWGFAQTYRVIFLTLRDYNHHTLPGLVQWMNKNNYLIDLLSVFWVVSVFSSVLFQRYEQLRKENLKHAIEKERLEKEKEIERRELIAQQKLDLEKQVEERTAELKESLEELKTTQKQLVQREKMASLGELTAGIAHEIQNPLNFVNNFSEVSIELLNEMKEELEKGNKEDAYAIASDIHQNLEKIASHGHRADAIVKGMLQHSRSSTGSKEFTDLNILIDEFLQLSYKSLRAKSPDFNCTIETNYDASIGKVNIIPQDMARVILNLFNNGFYSVMEKKKKAGEKFEPKVSVSTRKLPDNKVEITIRDNGEGIPMNIIDKIFMPFFTTKPTGQGTGLGLSLSYDIITKGHNGTIEVQTQEGEFAEFKIVLDDVYEPIVEKNSEEHT